MFVTRSWRRCSGGSNNCLAFFTQEIEDVSLLPPDLTKTFRNRKRKPCCFCSAMKGEAGVEFQLLARCLILWRVHFLVIWFCEQATLQDLGFPTQGTVYESPQSSPTWMVWCSISRTEIIAPYCLTTVLLLETDTKRCYDIIFSTSFSITLPASFFNRTRLLRTTQFRPDNIWNTSFQTCGWGGVDWFRGLRGILNWPMWLIYLVI